MAKFQFEVFSRVSGFNYKSDAFFDTYNSLIINKNFQDASKFELVVPYSRVNTDLFQPETLLYLQDSYYYVNDIRVNEDDANKMTISGKSLFGKAYDRLIDTNYKKTDKPELIAADIFANYIGSTAAANRKFDYLTMATTTPFSNSSIAYQNSYGQAGDEFKELMTGYNFGVRETSVHGIVGNVIEFVQGHDFSDVIEISTDYENLTKAGYENSTADFKNVAVTLGEGEGADRIRVDYTNETTEPSGIDRYEVLVDARDMQREQQSEETYKGGLRDRAKSKLAERSRVLSLSGQIVIGNKTFTLGKDFGLGDTVKLKSTLFGVSNTAMITAIQYTYDDKGEYIEPTFGRQSPTVFDVLKRK